MSKNTQVNDADVEALLKQLDNAGEPPATPIVDVDAVSPATLALTPEEPASTEAQAEAKQVDDERPIVINLPARQDPSTLLVADGIPQVQALDANGNLAVEKDPAHRKDVEVVQSASTVTPSPVASVAPVAPTVHASVEAADAAASLPDEVKEILRETGCYAWLNADDPAKPYWGIRNGPRRGGVPMNASAEDWRGRCSSISA